MRGLDEIQKTNATPHADNGEENFGTKHVGGTDFDRRDPAALAALRALGDGYHRAQANAHLENLDRIRLSGDEILEAILGGGKLRGPSQEEAETEALFGILLIDALINARPKSQARPDNTGPATGDETGGVKPTAPQKSALPPFETFWSQRQHLNYGEAKKLYAGGETPVGAITFVGKEWDGIRAVPAKPVAYLGGARPAYHGQFRVANLDGSHTWRTVINQNDDAISYQIPEAALTAARDRKNGNS